MARRRRPSFAIITTIAFAVAFGAWTALTLSGALAALDRAAERPGLDAASPSGQIAAGIAIAFWTGVDYAAVIGLAIWANRRRLRNLAVALALSVVLSWGVEFLVKVVVARPRPSGVTPLITASGWSYPSGHMVAMMTLAIAVIATTTTTRQSRNTVTSWRVIGVFALILIGLDRWLLQAHYLTDIVGGVLLGGFTASLALATARVHILPEIPTRRVPSVRGKKPRCAVIVNPTKVGDWAAFRRHIDYEIAQRGWAQPLWLETTEDDPGKEMARIAVEQEVNLVLAAGGDGTVRLVSAGLSGTNIPLAILPAGTGNLLARNLGVPLDESDALEVAFAGNPRRIDLVKVAIDAGEPEHFAVMAGMGADAAIMNETNPELKKIVGPAAYFIAVASSINRPPFECHVSVDDSEAVTTQASLAMVGNVGMLQGNIQLLPDAQPDDGQLDVIVASPKRMADWARIAGSVISGQDDPKEIARATGSRVAFRTDSRIPYQLDGDTAGECSTMVAEVEPGALLVMVPGR